MRWWWESFSKNSSDECHWNWLLMLLAILKKSYIKEHWSVTITMIWSLFNFVPLTKSKSKIQSNPPKREIEGGRERGERERKKIWSNFPAGLDILKIKNQEVHGFALFPVTRIFEQAAKQVFLFAKQHQQMICQHETKFISIFRIQLYRC